jgi:hypothetical protein
MLRLGGQTTGTDNAREFSSAAKATSRTRSASSAAADVIVRHSEEGGGEARGRGLSVRSSTQATDPASIPRGASDLYVRDETADRSVSGDGR